jgi:ketosteroid isomerase-like protein
VLNPLPAPVSAYYDASEAKDVDAVVRCFADDAVVNDESQEWRGPAGVRQWREGVADVYQYTTEVRRVVAHPAVDGVERFDISVHLKGNFPGGEVDLMNQFAIRDGLIVHLRTGG